MISVRASIASHYLAACEEELQCPKPGNVHVFAGGHGMTAADFVRSAEVSAPLLCDNDAGLGARIRNAAIATRAAVGQNTNLGILLLCVPLAVAAERCRSVSEIIAAADLTDAEAVFDAIRIARPGGLGDARAHDVRAPAKVLLPVAMREAAARDMIARQWCNGFAEVLGPGVTAYRGAAKWPALASYLYFLATWPDSHVQRKHGAAVAGKLRRIAQRIRRLLNGCDDPTQMLPELLAWDSKLKADGINPGTSADLAVATSFAFRLRQART